MIRVIWSNRNDLIRLNVLRKSGAGADSLSGDKEVMFENTGDKYPKFSKAIAMPYRF